MRILSMFALAAGVVCLAATHLQIGGIPEELLVRDPAGRVRIRGTATADGVELSLLDANQRGRLALRIDGAGVASLLIGVEEDRTGIMLRAGTADESAQLVLKSREGGAVVITLDATRVATSVFNGAGSEVVSMVAGGDTQGAHIAMRAVDSDGRLVDGREALLSATANRSSLVMHREGRPVVELKEEGGSASLAVGGGVGSGRVLMVASKPERVASVLVMDPSGVPRVRMQASEDLGVGVAVADGHGAPRIKIGLTAAGEVSVKALDGAGAVVKDFLAGDGGR